MKVRFGSLDADFQGLQDGIWLGRFGDEEKFETRWCSCVLDGDLLTPWNCKEGGRGALGGREGGGEGVEVVSNAGCAGFYRRAREEGGMAHGVIDGVATGRGTGGGGVCAVPGVVAERTEVKRGQGEHGSAGNGRALCVRAAASMPVMASPCRTGTSVPGLCREQEGAGKALQ